MYLNRPAQAKKITRRPIKTQPITPLDSPLVLFAWLPSGGYPRCPFVLLGLLLAFTTEQQEQRHDNDWITLTTLAHEVLLCPCSIVCSRQPAVSLLYAADRREHDWREGDGASGVCLFLSLYPPDDRGKDKSSARPRTRIKDARRLCVWWLIVDWSISRPTKRKEAAG